MISWYPDDPSPHDLSPDDASPDETSPGRSEECWGEKEKLIFLLPTSAAILYIENVALRAMYSLSMLEHVGRVNT
jgi:hypothetical protein